MFQSQKDTIITLLKARDAARNYGKANYWFSYKDFLDPADIFTEFCCENLDGKQNYISLIEKMLDADKTAKIFVEVYGLFTIVGGINLKLKAPTMPIDAPQCKIIFHCCFTNPQY